MNNDFIKKYSLSVQEENPIFNTIPEVKQVQDVVHNFRKLYSDDILIYESFYAMYLNQKNAVIGVVKISQGGITSTIVDIRIIFKYAIELLATSIIICHNHPSGNIMPSNQDKELTSKINIAANYLDIKLLDHIILSKDNYYSFANENILN